ncbi:MAG: hypothetical protein Rubg2KO_31790 [Rubricoccaceae bacterium]
MSVDRWDRLQPLFEEALELAPSERDAFIRDACPDDLELADALQALLAGNEQSAFLDGGIASAVPVEDAIGEAHLPPEAVPERIGVWTVGERIGAGGMGAVYRATRSDGAFEQTVALKLVKRGMDSEAVLRRFQAERRILARLEHPGIARIIDGGLAEDGRPYLAMEFVEGTPITAFCTDRALSLNDRIDLFRQVCEAVQYAHRQLVVHRDLKPSNILVTEDDTGGRRVKLLDFGIAKVLSGEDTGDPLTVLTAPGQLMLTPEYAAPEQLSGDTISTATDVYALGVILYELLVGTRPYTFETRSPSAIEHVVATAQPTRPSTVASSNVASPERLRRELAGDLDVICLMALRKEPDRRYGSAAALGDDLRRYRERLPVLARPDTLRYRLQTFARRNRTGLAATAVALLAIGIVTTLSFASVRAERDRARLEAAKAEEVSVFLSDLFTSSNPAESRGAEITARELLERGAERIETDLGGQPEVQAQMLHVVGEVHKNLGQYAEAESLLTRALASRRAILGPTHPSVGTTLSRLGLLYERQGRFEEATETLTEAIAIHQRVAEDHPVELANSLHGKSWAELRLGRYAAAEQLITEALQIKRRVFGDRHPEIAYSLNVLGDVYTHQGRYDEAEATHRQALALRRELLGPDHLDAAFSLHNLAAALRDAERWAEAEASYRESLELWLTHFGEASQEYANTLSQLALVIGMQGRYAEAEVMHDDAYVHTVDAVGAEHPKMAGLLARRSRVLADEGRLSEAEAILRDGLAIQRRVVGEAHPDVAEWLAGLAILVNAQGRADEAAQLLDESDDLCQRHQPDAPECRQRVRDVRAGVAG